MKRSTAASARSRATEQLPHPLAPCAECPFLKTSRYLCRDRAAQIADTHLVEGGGAIFHCHKTSSRRKRDRKHCAGALLFALANGVCTLAMQLGERLGFYQLSRIRGIDRVYKTRDAMVCGHSDQ